MTSIETKYRPEEFDEVIGQEAAVKSLKNAVEKRLGTTFLFTGPSGVGKTTLARIAAKALGCLPADLEEVDAATKTGIEDMRAVTSTLLYRPLGKGAVKGIIVDECHALSKAAMQSLLKILEDPPTWVFWFLCTTEPTKVPKAIQTRCLTYQLKEVRFNDLVDLLASTEEAKDVDDDILELCAKEAGGSPRQALSNLGVCLTAENKKEAAELLRSAAEVKEAFELARALFNGADWEEVKDLLGALKETSPESVRHVVRAYMTKVVLDSKKKSDTEAAFAILEAFSQPFNSFDGMSPLVLACGRLVMGA
jgi:DNA polymerase III subunit gamma/tau